MQAKPGQILDKTYFFAHWLKGLGPPPCPRVCERSPGPQGTPQITPFRHQMGRSGTIWDLGTGNPRRISARISPGGSLPLHVNCVFTILDICLGKRVSLQQKTSSTGTAGKSGVLGPMVSMFHSNSGPKGAQGAHVERIPFKFQPKAAHVEHVPCQYRSKRVLWAPGPPAALGLHGELHTPTKFYSTVRQTPNYHADIRC